MARGQGRRGGTTARRRRPGSRRGTCRRPSHRHALHLCWRVSFTHTI
uniref:Uncharacterized protein n=1 Tax=Arundo donax TaxID=35708 RepID=A0A0A8Z4G4_ARUDO